MTSVLAVRDSRARADVTTLLRRAGRYGDGSARLTAHESVVVVSVPITVSSGLLDLGPTILGMRALRMREPATFDAVVPAAAIIDAFAEDADLEVPSAGTMPAWASVSPPRSGWQPVADVEADAVRIGAAEAASAVERELPSSPGEAVVRRVRRSIWSGQLAGHAMTLGMCVALEGLGFLAAGVDVVRITRAGGWTRGSTRLGDVLER